MATNLPVESQAFNSSKDNEVARALANLTVVTDYKETASEYISQPFSDKTPPEKVKKRPDGFDYVESSWMDFQTKKFMPFYKYQLLHTSFEMGFVNVIISLEDRITGNTELGAGSARIQVSRGVSEPGFRDVIDMSNNIKAALTNAIKNAQSRYGIAADIYQKRESIPSDPERTRKNTMEKELNRVDPTKAKVFSEQWNTLGTDFSTFLDRWQVYLDRKNQSHNSVTDAKSDKKKVNIL